MRYIEMAVGCLAQATRACAKHRCLHTMLRSCAKRVVVQTAVFCVGARCLCQRARRHSVHMVMDSRIIWNCTNSAVGRALCLCVYDRGWGAWDVEWMVGRRTFSCESASFLSSVHHRAKGAVSIRGVQALGGEHRDAEVAKGCRQTDTGLVWECRTRNHLGSPFSWDRSSSKCEPGGPLVCKLAEQLGSGL